MTKQKSPTTNFESSLDEFGPAIEVAKLVTTKSEQIRTLAANGMSRGDIAKTLGIRYQHVRNVLITPLKRNGELK